MPDATFDVSAPRRSMALSNEAGLEPANISMAWMHAHHSARAFPMSLPRGPKSWKARIPMGQVKIGTSMFLAAVLAACAAGCAEELETSSDETFALEENEAPGDEDVLQYDQCKVLPDGSLCVAFDKLGTFVRTITIARTKQTPLCNAQAFFDVYDGLGQRIEHKLGPFAPGCRTGTLRLSVLINQEYPTGRKVCAGVREGFVGGPFPAPEICVPLVPAPLEQP
jgi:hypothetical protein